MRPTSERVREAVFNVLGNVVTDARVLELFAGTGAFGLEALSRGAESVVFVDRDPKVTERLRETVESFGVRDAVSVVTMDARQAMRTFLGRGWSFGIVFLDPPYGTRLISQVLCADEFPALVEDDGIVVAEREARTAEVEVSPVFRRSFSRRYGDTVVEFYER